MKQYAAGEAFLELVKVHPEDFDATHDEGRDHSTYTVKHKYRAVSVNIDVHNGLEAVSAHTGVGLMYVSEPVLRELVNWAISVIAEKKILVNVAKDNSGIQSLYDFYNNQ